MPPSPSLSKSSNGQIQRFSKAPTSGKENCKFDNPMLRRREATHCVVPKSVYPRGNSPRSTVRPTHQRAILRDERLGAQQAVNGRGDDSTGEPGPFPDRVQSVNPGALPGFRFPLKADGGTSPHLGSDKDGVTQEIS